MCSLVPSRVLTLSRATQDAVPGIYPRWHVSFNITMLRLVSFNMDYYWAYNKAGPSDVSDAALIHPAFSSMTRSQVPHSRRSNDPLSDIRSRHILMRITLHTCSTHHYTLQAPS